MKRLCAQISPLININNLHITFFLFSSLLDKAIPLTKQDKMDVEDIIYIFKYLSIPEPVIDS